MAPRRKTFVIIGAGLAGARAAERLRQEGFDGRVVLVGEEPELPYDRPPLSKGFLTGVDPTPPLLHDAAFYAGQGIEARTGTRVTALDPGSAMVTLDTGERLSYDALLIATGASPVELEVPGAGLERVHYLRTLRDARRLRDDITGADRAVVIGGGWVGTEIAAALRQKGAEVALVHRGAMPLERAMGREVAEVYRDAHIESGVSLVSGDVSEILGDDRAEGVRLASGATVEGDLIVVGIGARPRTEVAEVAGLAVDGG